MKKAESKSKKTDRKKLILLDAHAIIHRAYHGMPDFTTREGVPTGALYGLSTMLMKIISELSPEYVVACYDLPQKTFRHEAYTDYKAGRAKADDALVAQLISSRTIFEAFNIPIYDCPGFEADDMLGTIVSQILSDKKYEDIDVVIASGDMDTLQLVSGTRVQVFTLKKGITDTVLYDEEAVVSRFGFVPKLLPDYKGLRGDPSDNIIGITGIGEKTATSLVGTFGTIEQIYEALKKDSAQVKKEAGVTDRIITLLVDGEEEALFSKTLATIRPDAPISFSLPVPFFESANFAKVETLFTELEFKSLVSRLRSFLGKTDEVKEEKNTVATPQETVDPRTLLETSIALWLIDSDMPTPSQEDILTYSKKKTFKEAREVIFKTLAEKKLDEVFREIEEPIIDPIGEMKSYGVGIDQQFFAELSATYHKELERLSQEIYVLADGEFNINSPKQLGELLFEKLGLKPKGKRGAAGGFSTKAEVLEELAEMHPIIPKILEQRELQKLLSTYIDVIPAMAGDDGRLHAEFIQHGTTTGRFSSQNPNMQNIPIKSELGRAIRKGFVAAPGKVLVALDYSQIELRVVAIMSGDVHLTEIFKEGKDVHAGVASRVFGVPENEVDADMRRKAKVINFGIIYGMGVSALKKNLGTARDEAQLFYDRYFEQMSGVREYLDQVKVFARTHGYTETLFGRKRQFPNIQSKLPFLRALAERMATNAPLQGTAADIIKLAIRYATEDLKTARLSENAKLVLQIHDELVYEVDESIVDKVIPLLQNAMTSVLSRSWKEIKTPVPLLVSCGMGKNLGETK